MKHDVMNIKNCPFCGGKAYIAIISGDKCFIDSDGDWVEPLSTYEVRCFECGCCSPRCEETKTAVYIWNSRVSK